MVNELDINNAQKAWGDGIVAIASAHLSGGDYVEIARNPSKHCMRTASVLFCLNLL